MNSRFWAAATRGMPPARRSHGSEALEARRELTPVRNETLREYEKLVRKLDQSSETAPPARDKESHG